MACNFVAGLLAFSCRQSVGLGLQGGLVRRHVCSQNLGVPVFKKTILASRPPVSLASSRSCQSSSTAVAHSCPSTSTERGPKQEGTGIDCPTNSMWWWWCCCFSFRISLLSHRLCCYCYYCSCCCWRCRAAALAFLFYSLLVFSCSPLQKQALYA